MLSIPFDAASSLEIEVCGERWYLPIASQPSEEHLDVSEIVWKLDGVGICCAFFCAFFCAVGTGVHCIGIFGCSRGGASKYPLTELPAYYRNDQNTTRHSTIPSYSKCSKKSQYVPTSLNHLPLL